MTDYRRAQYVRIKLGLRNAFRRVKRYSLVGVGIAGLCYGIYRCNPEPVDRAVSYVASGIERIVNEHD